MTEDIDPQDERRRRKITIISTILDLVSLKICSDLSSSASTAAAAAALVQELFRFIVVTTAISCWDTSVEQECAVRTPRSEAKRANVSHPPILARFTSLRSMEILQKKKKKNYFYSSAANSSPSAVAARV